MALVGVFALELGWIEVFDCVAILDSVFSLFLVSV